MGPLRHLLLVGRRPDGAERAEEVVDVQVLVVTHLLEVGREEPGQGRAAGHVVVLVGRLAGANGSLHLLGPVREDVPVPNPGEHGIDHLPSGGGIETDGVLGDAEGGGVDRSGQRTESGPLDLGVGQECDRDRRVGKEGEAAHEAVDGAGVELRGVALEGSHRQAEPVGLGGPVGQLGGRRHQPVRRVGDDSPVAQRLTPGQQVTHRRAQPPGGERHRHLDGRGVDQLPVGHCVATGLSRPLRPVRAIRRLPQSEGLEDVVVEVRGVAAAGDPLDDEPEEDVVRARVAEALARVEVERLGGNQVDHRLEGGARFGPAPRQVGVVPDPRRVVEEVPDGDATSLAGEVGKRRGEVVVEAELPRLDQLEDGGGGELPGEGADAVDGVLRRRDPSVDIGQAIALRHDGPPISDDRDRHARQRTGDESFRGQGVDPFLEAGVGLP